MNRRKKAKLNILTTLVSQAITIVCGIFMPFLFISNYGSEVYGATTSISSFLGYIAILEGGVCGVARAQLYKPLSENDSYGISKILRATKSFFNKIGLIFAAYVLVIALTFKLFSNFETLDYLFSFFLVISISVSSFAQYFIGISYATLLQADQKTYVNYLITSIVTALNFAVVFLLIRNGVGIVAVKLISGLIFAIRPIALFMYVKKKYPLVGVDQRDLNECLPNKWSAMGQHIAYFLHSNIDIFLLTILASLKDVSVYAVYSMIILNLQTLVCSFASGMESLFGDMLARKEDEKLNKTFSLYDTLISFVSVVSFSCCAILILCFVQIYTRKVTDANYYQPLLAFFLTASSFFYCLRQPYHGLIIAAGHFKQTRFAAYGEALINIVLSLVLLYLLGMAGVALATLIATLFRHVYYQIYLSKNIVNLKGKYLIKRNVVNALFGLLLSVSGFLVVNNLAVDTYLLWFLCAAIVFASVTLFSFLISLWFYRQDVMLLRAVLKPKA